MMYRILLIFFLSVIVIPSYGDTIKTIRPYNIDKYYHYPYYNKNYSAQNIARTNLTALEQYALKKNYSRENDIRRLERLEELAFGSIQSGDILNRYKNVENAILTRPQNYYNQSLLNKIGNYFAGQTTGFTPNIIQNVPAYTYNMPSGYKQRRINQYSNGIFGNNFNYFDNNYTSQTGVRIVD